MPSSLIDSDYYRDMFGTAAMRNLFSDDARFTAWLDTEVALARAEARCGLIPETAAEAIASAAKLENLDIAAMKTEYEQVGFPILPLVHQLAAACDPESARYVHWGATTQDIVDTGLVLQMHEALDLIDSELSAIVAATRKLADHHRDTVMPGRTFQQHAAPITFGFKAAVWLDELTRHQQRLAEIRPRALRCQFGGAVGTLATLGDRGLDVVRELSRELDLPAPPISWHTSRDAWAELLFALTLLTTTFGKIGNEVATLMRTEVGELREPFAPGRGGSSTMPHKRNPIACPILIAIADQLRNCTTPLLASMTQEHERGVAAQPTEWLALSDAFILTSGSLRHARHTLENLEVDPERMRANLDLTQGLLMAESVMMGLAPHTGRNQAHDLVKKASNLAITKQTHLRDALLRLPEITTHLTPGQLEHLLNPANYLGTAKQMIQNTLNNSSP